MKHLTGKQEYMCKQGINTALLKNFGGCFVVSTEWERVRSKTFIFLMTIIFI